MNAARAELARVVTYVFQRVGRRRISDDDWVRVLSLERQWMPPSRARRVAADARAQGFLRNAGDRDYEVGLEAEGVALAVDFRPDLALLEAAASVRGDAGSEPPAPLFRRIVEAIARGLGQSEAEVVGRINATQPAVGGLLRAEVAALHYGALQGVDLSMFYDEVAATLRAPPAADAPVVHAQK